MQNRRNLYRILHVQPDAPAPIIKSSYRTIMQTLRQHPDLGGEAEAAQLLNEAVAVLCDPVKRANYDEQWRRSRKRNTVSTEAAAPLLALTDPDTTATNNACPFCQAATQPASQVAAIPYGDESLCHRCGGARLLATDQQDNPVSTTRNEHRTVHTAIATLWQHWPLSKPQGVRIVDLSARGAALVGNCALSTHQTVLLKSPMVNAIARIRYSQPLGNTGQMRLGLTFLTLKMTAPPGEFLALQA